MKIKDPQIQNRCQEAVFHAESSGYVNMSPRRFCWDEKQWDYSGLKLSNRILGDRALSGLCHKGSGWWICSEDVPQLSCPVWTPVSYFWNSLLHLCQSEISVCTGFLRSISFQYSLSRQLFCLHTQWASSALIGMMYLGSAELSQPSCSQLQKLDMCS